MYCAIGERQIKVLDNEVNRSVVRERLYSEFNCGMDWSEEVRARAGKLLSTLTLYDMLRMDIGDISMSLFNSAADSVLRRVCEVYPKLRVIIDAEPTCEGDEYYEEWHRIYDCVLPADVEEMVDWDADYEGYKNMIIKRMKQYIPFNYFELDYSFDVSFCPIVNVKRAVGDPEHLTEFEREDIIEEAIKQIREQFEDKINEENLSSIDIYRGVE